MFKQSQNCCQWLYGNCWKFSSWLELKYKTKIKNSKFYTPNLTIENQKIQCQNHQKLLKILLTSRLAQVYQERFNVQHGEGMTKKSECSNKCHINFHKTAIVHPGNLLFLQQSEIIILVWIPIYNMVQI